MAAASRSLVSDYLAKKGCLHGKTIAGSWDRNAKALAIQIRVDPR